MRLEEIREDAVLPLEPSTLFGLESDAVPDLICEGHNGAWLQVIGWGIVGAISLPLMPTYQWLLGVVPFGIILPIVNLVLALSEGRVQRAFLPNEVRLITNKGSRSSSYETWRKASLGSTGPDRGFGWKVKAVNGLSLSPADLDDLPSEDLMMRALAAKGGALQSPWGTKRSVEPVQPSAAPWRARSDTKWPFLIPGLVWLAVILGAALQGLTSDLINTLIMMGPGLIWEGAWSVFALTRLGAKGLIEFSDKGVSISAKGQTIHEIAYSDLKRFEVQTQRAGRGRQLKRLAAITHYGREIPLTDWLPRWDKTGDFVISQALKRGLPLEIAGLKPLGALADE